MYCVDTLNRLNYEEEVRAREEAEVTCDYCDEPATKFIEVFNPADAVRKPKIEGAYDIINICEECDDQGLQYDGDVFNCAGCGELFITNHSWDVLYVTIDGEMYCQECAIENMEGVTLEELIEKLKSEDTSDWLRINNIPGKEELWSGEYSGYGDFPGHTSFDTVIAEIREKFEELGLAEDTLLYPVVTQGYQFSVVLGVFYDKAE